MINKVKLFSYKLYSCCHKLSWSAYGNKLKTVYEHVISCFHMFSQTVSRVLMPMDKLHPHRPRVSQVFMLVYKGLV